MSLKFSISKIGLFLGPFLFFIIWFLPPSEALNQQAINVAAIALLMAIWWATEAIPIPMTSLIPLVAFPFMGVMDMKPTAASYGHPLIFLFLGGFLIAIAMQRWNLHKRIALNIVAIAGTKPSRVIGGFMLASCLVSMWVTNTATTMMMMPIGLSIIDMFRSSKNHDKAGIDNFAKALMLGIAYAATIGGLCTLVGTVPNALMAAFAEKSLGITISFTTWMMVGCPIAALLLPTAWLILVKFIFPTDNLTGVGSKDFIRKELDALGPFTKEETMVLTVLVFTAIFWIFRPLIGKHILPNINLSDTGIAIFAAITLFVLPSNWRKGEFLLNWEWGKRLPWDLLLLFGGGLALAAAIKSSGLSIWIGDTLTWFQILPTFLVLAGVTIVIIFLTELTSNTATTATFLPVIAALAVAIHMPSLSLLVPITIAASCAFMLPVATPPNAIVYGSHQFQISDMMKAGFYLNIASVIVISVFAYFLLPFIFPGMR